MVCYERAAARILEERGGRADRRFIRKLVHTAVLPTAVASTSDHYVVLQPGQPPRFATVEAVARACGLAAGSPLMETLSTPGVLTPCEAVSSLGRSVHKGVAKQLLLELVGRGCLGPGLTYGTAYSGIDVFAAAVEEVTEGNWRYVFAGERVAVARRALLHAWGRRGLTEETCFWDSTGAEARGAAHVDLYVITPRCEPHSRRNHSRSGGEQLVSMGELWQALEYVSRARPRVVVVENVSEPSSVKPTTRLLTRLAGYSVETGILDPRDVARAPIARRRQFWVLVRRGDA